MRQGMCPYIKEHRLGLPRRLGRLRGGPSLRLRHPGDALNLRLLLLHRSALKPPLLQSVLRPRRGRQIPRRSVGFSEVGVCPLAQHRRLSGPLLAIMEGSGSGCLGRGGLARGIQDPLLQTTSVVRPTPPHAILFPSSIRGKVLEQEFQDLLHKQAIEPPPQAPGFYSRLFVVQKDSGAWCPIIDLSTLNTYIASQRFHMETPQSILRSIRPGDWMILLDLQDAYF